MKQIEAELVAPDAETRWPHPMGYPVVLSDGKAYWFACAAAEGRAKVLLEKIDDVQAFVDRYQNQIPGGEMVIQAETQPEAETPIKPSDVIIKLSEFAAVNLSLQYGEATVNRILESGALDAKTLNLVLAVANGANPGYEVTAKKKPTN